MIIGIETTVTSVIAIFAIAIPTIVAVYLSEKRREIKHRLYFFIVAFSVISLLVVFILHFLDVFIPTGETGGTKGTEETGKIGEIGEFNDYVSDYFDGKIKYSSPEYGIDVILPDGYLCKKYLLASQNSQEEIELQYDSDLNIEIAIGEMPYQGFYSLEEYSAYYLPIYNQSPNFYKSFNFNKSIPYCVFSFNTDNGNEIFYELIQDINGIYCAAKFSYPTSKRGVYNEMVTDYCSYVKSQK